MINRNKPQLNSNRTLGSSPLQRMDLNLQTQKENHFSNNLQPYAKPLISPKHNQPEEILAFDRPAKQKTNFNRPVRSPRSMVNTDRTNMTTICCNHQNKKADCRIQTEDGFEYFCNRCAAQLVTQGYKAEQLQNQTDQGMKFSKKNSNALPDLPHFEQEPIYHEIIDIIKLCNNVVSEHTSNIDKFSSLEEEYNQQADLTSAFYDRLIDIIEEMKADHLGDLLQEKDKYTQIADIENDNSRENIIEINTIKNDIQGNMQEVLEGIQNSGDSSECRESLGHYRHKLTLYRHQAEEQLESISEVTRYSQMQIDSMLHNFENFLGRNVGRSRTCKRPDSPADDSSKTNGLRYDCQEYPSNIAQGSSL